MLTKNIDKMKLEIVNRQNQISTLESDISNFKWQLKYLTTKLLESKRIMYKKVKKDVSYTAYEEFLKNFVYNK